MCRPKESRALSREISSGCFRRAHRRLQAPRTTCGSEAVDAALPEHSREDEGWKDSDPAGARSCIRQAPVREGQGPKRSALRPKAARFCARQEGLHVHGGPPTERDPEPPKGTPAFATFASQAEGTSLPSAPDPAPATWRRRWRCTAPVG